MSRIISAMVLSAGFGLRMRPLTLTRPKPLVEVCGRPLLDHVLDRLAENGVENVVVNTHYLGEQIERHLAGRSTPPTVISREDELLETGGGIAKALPLLGDQPFYVVNADSFWLDGFIPALERLTRQWDERSMDCLLLLQRTVSAMGYDGPGDFYCDPLGRPKRRRGGEVAPFLYGGVQIMHPRAMAGEPVEPFSVNRVWDRLIDAGRLAAMIHDGLWFHVGSPGDLADTEAYLEEHRLAPMPSMKAS